MGVWRGICPDYINLFNLAFHHIWTDSISLPLPWSLKAYNATLCSFTLFTTSFNFPSSLRSPFLPFLALRPSLILPVARPVFPQMASVWPSPKQTHASSQRFALVPMSASQVITSQWLLHLFCLPSPLVILSLSPFSFECPCICLCIHWSMHQTINTMCLMVFSPSLFVCLQSFPRWETDTKISCEQTLVKGEGPKTSWSRELTNDGKLILVTTTNYPPSQSLDLELAKATRAKMTV